MSGFSNILALRTQRQILIVIKCWELLANNVVSVCTGRHVFKSDLSEQIPLFPIPTVAVGM